MSKLGLAIAITAKAFENKLDKGGSPYILHCLEVMYKTIGDDSVKCAAVMHDLIEDCPGWTVEMLLDLGFTTKTVRLVQMLTHDPEIDYMDYIKSISNNLDARQIKMRDLEHNSNITRMKGLRKKDLDRLEKYHRAYMYLNC